jgi:hypothetical protein
MSDSIAIILAEDVAGECDAQVAKWGVQHHPNGTGQTYYWSSVEARNICEERFKFGTGTWADILKEEFYEALAEEDPVKLRAELVQVAAVCASWIRDIDSRAAAA